jgi:hypothetical protein
VQIYQTKVILRGSHPRIWRLIQVKSDIHLASLHRILQVAMGWYDSHLHRFLIRGERYGIPDRDDIGPKRVVDERTCKLKDLKPGKNFRFTYFYDFGDGWEHELLVEEILSPEPGVRYPVCLEGECACPPEDVGGILGYENFLEAMRNPQHPEHEKYSEWIGGSFDPEAFEISEVNRKLQRIK